MSEDTKAKFQGQRRTVKLNKVGDDYWEALEDGSKNEVFADLVDMAIPLRVAGLNDPVAIQAVIDDGIFNLYSVLSNPENTPEVAKAMRWAIAKVVLGDEIEMIKAGAIVIGSNSTVGQTAESHSANSEEETQSLEPVESLMPKGEVASFLMQH